MMHYWGQPYVRGYSFWGNGLFGLFFTVFFCVVIAFLFLSLVKGFRRHVRDGGDFEEENPNKALNILKERYAKGEITKKVFEEMKKDIS